MQTDDAGISADYHRKRRKHGRTGWDLSDTCRHDDNVTTTDGDIVCRLCGTVLVSRLEVFIPSYGKARTGYTKKVCFRPTAVSTPYKPIFHFHERLSQWVMQEPAIHEEVLQLFWDEYIFGEYRRGSNFNKETTTKIIGNISKNMTISQYERLVRLHHNNIYQEGGEGIGWGLHIKRKDDEKDDDYLKRIQSGVKRYLSKKYLEKWVSIRWKLTGYGPGDPLNYEKYKKSKAYSKSCELGRLTRLLEVMFKGIQKPFQEIRHTKECDRKTPDCHKKFGCRHNLPHYNTTIRYFLVHAYLNGHNEAIWHLHQFPPLRTRSKLMQHEKMMRKFWEYNNWYPFVKIF